MHGVSRLIPAKAICVSFSPLLPCRHQKAFRVLITLHLESAREPAALCSLFEVNRFLMTVNIKTNDCPVMAADDENTIEKSMLLKDQKKQKKSHLLTIN